VGRTANAGKKRPVEAAAPVVDAVDRRAERHARRVEQMTHVLEQQEQAARPLGVEGQMSRRNEERHSRMEAVAFAHWAGQEGLSRAAAADQIGLSAGTLGRWERSWELGHLPVHPLGRPCKLADPVACLEVAEQLDQLGPATGLVVLQGLFPEVTRSQLRDLQNHFRGGWREDHAFETQELEWALPGTVWAMDFTDPPGVIDGLYEHVLTVRDLAGSMELEALPVVYADGETVAAALESLFIRFGAPLVLKSDNGGAFVGSLVQELLARWQVVPLLSPLYLPRYNGSVEASNGALKTRAHYLAAQHGRPGAWTCDDVETARLQANATSRPWGPRGPTPRERWDERVPITTEQRDEFGCCVEEMKTRVCGELFPNGSVSLGREDQAAVARSAVRRALETLGYLVVRRRRITPPFKAALRDNIR
jgi:transposase InsO family protein